MNTLGFGMMRLPLLSSDQTDFDFPQLEQMVDEFLDAGFTYFDTSVAYHNGQSESAVRRAVVERKPRESFTIATKFPTFFNISEDKIEATFQQHFDNLGVDYIDYYLLHNVQTVYYDGIDGTGGIIKQTHLFDHAAEWLRQGRIKHLGFSFHSSSQVLDRILTEHPEVEFVQIALNPIDWESEFVQAKACYDVIRKHSKKVVIMEVIKGGGLAKLPAEAEKILKDLKPEQSIASWSLRFALGLPDVIAVLSGMSNLEQLRDNITTTKAAQPLNDTEEKALWEAMKIYREEAPIPQSEIDKYHGLTWNGVPVTAILQAYSICQVQPDPGFSDDNNYFKNALIENSHLDLRGELPSQKVILSDGTDKTDVVDQAVAFLKSHTF